MKLNISKEWLVKMAEKENGCCISAGVPLADRKCDHCGKPATCFGTYENIAAFACDEFCGHGCEDGHCVPVCDLPKHN